MNAPRFCRLLIACLALLVTLAPAPALTNSAEQRNWVEVRTTNFVLRSVLTEKDTLALAEEFELFRSALAEVTGYSVVTGQDPVEVYILRKPGDAKALGYPRWHFAGSVNSIDKVRIVLRERTRIDLTTSFRWSYTDALLEHHYPLWMRTGLKNFLASTSGSSNADKTAFVDVGYKTEWPQRQGWIEIRQLLSGEQFIKSWSPTKKRQFQDEAAALVYILVASRNFNAQASHYVKLLESGMANAQAFEEAFSRDPEQLDMQMKKRQFKGLNAYYHLDASDLLADFSAEVRDISAEKMALNFGRLSVDRELYEQARGWFDKAVDKPETRAMAFAGLARVFAIEGDAGGAERHIEQAISIAPETASVYLDASRSLLTLAEKADGADERKILELRAQGHAKHALGINRTLSGASLVVGKTMVLQDRFNQAIDPLQAALALVPANPEARQLLAQAYAGVGLTSEARTLAKILLERMPNDAEMAFWATGLLASTEADASNAGQ